MKVHNFEEMRFFFETFHWDYWTYVKQPAFIKHNLFNYYNAKQEYEKVNGGDSRDQN